VSFVIPCPECGERSVYEFRFGGEVLERPQPDGSEEQWYRFSYIRRNRAGVQTEWWYHRFGCRQWLQAVRDTKTNKVTAAHFPDEKASEPLG
jgi:sarcosine oxidase subunit delta